MKIDGVSTRTIWLAEDGRTVEIIDQTRLLHDFVVARLGSLEDAARAITGMQVRGAPLIGVTAAYGVCLALARDASDAALRRAVEALGATRPTAVNLAWALAEMTRLLAPLPAAERVGAAYARAAGLADQDVALNAAIGGHGLGLLRDLQAAKGGTLNILTHCNAGWLATVDWGTALAPIYRAHDAGLAIHVWVDETRPRNQGAALTAWELGRHGVDHTVIVDNAGGHLMQRGLVDLCLTGSDRTTAAGDVCNKIGTYLKALAAKDTGVPFYVALPSSTIDWRLRDGLAEIPIEERSAREVSHVVGRDAAGQVVDVAVVPAGARAANPAFDVTPARLVSGLITERGIAAANADGLLELFPEHRGAA